MGERIVRDNARQVIVFGRLAPHKLSPRGRVEKQIPDRDCRSGITGRVLDVEQSSALDHDPCRRRVGLCLCYQLNFCDRGDRRQSLATKAQCADSGQIVRGSYLRSCVPLKGQDRVVTAHPFAIIADSHQPAPAKFDVDLETFPASVDRVFDKLFYDRRRTLDNLASRDLIGQNIRQDLDFVRRRVSHILSRSLTFESMIITLLSDGIYLRGRWRHRSNRRNLGRNDLGNK